MSRHRNLKYIIAEDQGDYDMDDYNEDAEEEDEEDIEEMKNEMIAEVMQSTRVNIKQAEHALESCEWIIEDAVRFIKQNRAKAQAARKKEEVKKEPAPVQKQAPAVQLPRRTEESKEERHARFNQIYPQVFEAQDLYSEVLQSKPSLSLVVIGHVDSGKSTIMGHLLYKLGYVDQKTMHKYQKESREIGKESFAFAWVLDQDGSERSHGITIDVGFNTFSTPNRDIILLDAPGHKDFVPKMISGAAQADAALLVIDSAPGQFERAFITENQQHGQTKEHAFLARSLGITQLLVAINKLEVSNWSQERFVEIQTQLDPFLRQVGYRPNQVIYVPISGLTGENLDQRSQIPELLEWYNGPCLAELIDQLEPAQRDSTKPLRVTIVDTYKLPHGTIQGSCVAGKVEGGILKIGDKIQILPSNLKATIKQIEFSGNLVDTVAAGSNVDMSLKDIQGEFDLVLPGNVMCGLEFPINYIRRFVMKAVLFDILMPVTKGSQYIMHLQSVRETVTVRRLVAQLDPSTGAVLKKNPRLLTKFMTASIELQCLSGVCMELYANFRALGRVTLRDGNETVMAGMVTEIIE